MKKLITPCLWFDPEKAGAKEAAVFYCSIFKDAKITTVTQMVVEFTASGHKFVCLNGAPQYRPNPSISFSTSAKQEMNWTRFGRQWRRQAQH